MNAEAKLKQLILTKYGSVRRFTQECELPYSTVATLFSRGIHNSSVSTLITVCNILGISADELLSGRITYLHKQTKPKSVEGLFDHLKHQLQNTQKLTLDDKPVDEAQINSLVKSLEVIIEIEKRKTK